MATFTLLNVSTHPASFSSPFLLPSSFLRSNSPRICKIVKKNSKNINCRSDGRSPSPEESDSNSNNILLKLAWYGSEALGIAASVFRPSTTVQPSGEQSSQDEVVGSIPKDAVVDAIKKDFERSYFVTGNLTTMIYEEDCEFADPAGSFRGLKRFKRNCSNFGSLLEKSSMKLMDWKDFEPPLLFDRFQEENEEASHMGSFELVNIWILSYLPVQYREGLWLHSWLKISQDKERDQHTKILDFLLRSKLRKSHEDLLLVLALFFFP